MWTECEIVPSAGQQGEGTTRTDGSSGSWKNGVESMCNAEEALKEER